MVLKSGRERLSSSQLEERLARIRSQAAIGVDHGGVMFDEERIKAEAKRRAFIAHGQPFNYSDENVFSLERLLGARTKLKSIRILLALNLAAARSPQALGPVELTDSLLLKALHLKNSLRTLNRFESMYVEPSAEARDLASQIKEWINNEWFNSGEARRYARPIPFSREALLELNEMWRGRLAIISNTHRLRTIRADLRDVVGLPAGFVSTLVIINQAEKPDPKGVRLAAKMLSEAHGIPIRASDFVLADDSVNGMLAASSAGALAVGISHTGVGTAEQLGDAGAILTVPDLHFLSSLLRQAPS